MHATPEAGARFEQRFNLAMQREIRVAWGVNQAEARRPFSACEWHSESKEETMAKHWRNIGQTGYGRGLNIVMQRHPEDLVYDLGGATEPIVSMGQQEGVQQTLSVHIWGSSPRGHSG